MPGDNPLVPINPKSLNPIDSGERHIPMVKSIEISEIDAFGQFRAVWDLIVKHQWFILTITVVLTALVAFYSFKMPPVYQAMSRVDVESEVPLLQSLNDLFKTGEADDAFLATQVSILQSDELAWDTIQKLGLGGSEKSGGKVVGIPMKMQTAAIRSLQGHLRVERAKDTRMILVEYESSDPKQAADVVNTLVEDYKEYNLRTKYDASRQATGWMEQRLDELKVKVEKSEQAMVDYERKNNIVSVGEKQTVAEARLDDLNKNLSTAQAERLSKESIYKMVAENEAQVGFIQSSSLLNGLEAKEVELKEQYSEAASHYGPTYPKALAFQDQLKDLDVLIARERKRAVENIRSEYQAAVQREKVLSDAVTRQNTEVEKVNQLLIQHNLLKREFESNQQLYDSLLAHLKDANVSATLQATNIHVIDKAVPPTAPIRPDKIRNIMFALAGGLGLGVALALTREALDNSIKSAQEVEKLTDLPTLAIVPIAQIRSTLVRGASPNAKRIALTSHDSGIPPALVVVKKPGAPVSEAYRALRTSVLLSTADRPPQVLLVTSSQPDEGKTVTALNLACTMAQKGSRVLLIDSDMRRPGIAKALKMSRTEGLSGILTGAYEYGPGLLIKIARVAGLSVLPCGPIPANPAELLCSVKMEALLKRVREDFDHIILDSPPILPITDATILSSIVDGVIMIVECERTTRAALSRACRIIEHAGGRIIGTVLNKVDVKRDGYYGYRYYHGYYSYSYKSYYADKGDRSSG
ncbi:MAG TPA: polysaccharide biosynthesis tyrosine autokinase [Terriglobia bacterium]|nr:polysaccharide biosynthesis tyrosine autokinase [Terriglobia bacterium]